MLSPEIESEIERAGAMVRRGFPWWLRPFLMGRGVSGITLGRRIYVRNGVSDVTNLLRHELVHIHQIQRLGVLRFYATYLWEYAVLRRRGYGPDEAYRRISFEAEAFSADKEESV